MLYTTIPNGSLLSTVLHRTSFSCTSFCDKSPAEKERATLRAANRGLTLIIPTPSLLTCLSSAQSSSPSRSSIWLWILISLDPDTLSTCDRGERQTHIGLRPEGQGRHQGPGPRATCSPPEDLSGHRALDKQRLASLARLGWQRQRGISIHIAPEDVSSSCVHTEVQLKCFDLVL